MLSFFRSIERVRVSVNVGGRDGLRVSVTVIVRVRNRLKMRIGVF